MHSDRMITLAGAAHQLSISWERAWRDLLKGDLAGEKRDGRGFVSADSVTRYAASRQSRNETDLAANARPEGK